MTRRFVLGFLGVGLAVLCASLASLERFEGRGAAEPVAMPEASGRARRDVPMSQAKPGEVGRESVQAAARLPARSDASTHTPANIKKQANAQANPEDRDEAPGFDVSSRAARRPAPGAPRLALHPVASAGGTVRFAGFDPEGPRALWLWRIREERAAVVARTRSESDGSFAFSPLRVPADGLAVVATAARAKPDEPGASRVGQLGPRMPRAPHGVARDVAPDDWHVRVTPLEAGGWVLVGTADEQVIGRFSLPALPGAPPRALDLSVVPDVGDDSVWLAHELPDGRRSAWRPVTWNKGSNGEEGEHR